MRIWIDGQCLQTSSRDRGIGRYALELIRSVCLKFPNEELCISFNAILPNELLHAQNLVSGLIRANNVYSWHSASLAGEGIAGMTAERQLSEIALAHHVRCIAPDIAVSLSPFEGSGDLAVPLNPSFSQNCPTVGVFYDAIPFRYAEQYLTSKVVRDYYERRFNSHSSYDGLLCISEFTKTEAEDIFKTVPAFSIDAGMPTQLVGIFDKFYSTDKLPERNFDDILYVGALDWRKNVDRVVDAFSILNQKGLNKYRLILAGSYHQEGAYQIRSKWKSLGLADEGISFRGQVSDRDLCDLYLRAGLIIQPSLMEGFGLTALEGAYFRCPVIGSNTGALKEIISSPKAMFNPLDAHDIASVIQDVASSGSVRDEISGIQFKNSTKYTWDRTAELFINAIYEVLKTKKKPYVVADNIRSSRKSFIEDLAKTETSVEDKAMVLALAEPKIGPRPRLIVDATSTILMDHKTGIQRVVKNISGRLLENSKNKNFSVVIGFCNDETGWFDTNGDLAKEPTKRKSREITARSNDTMLMLDSSWPFFNVYAPYLGEMRIQGAQVISCIYDTVPITMEAMCNPAVPPVFVDWFKNALVYSTGFVCISRAVADEVYALLEAIAFPRRLKIGYWQLGADFAEDLNAISQAKTTKKRPVFLMVGTLEPRKGHRVALDAFEQLWAEGIDVELVIVGKIGWGSAHLAERIETHPEYGSRLNWRSAAGDAELAGLYRECDALIAASFAEGFGLPLVEAAHFGMPILASDLAVFKEVAGETSEVYFFEVGSATALSGAVAEFLGNCRAASSRKVERATWLTWAESAARLEAVVISEDWYKIYEPQSQQPNVEMSDIGQIYMRSSLEEAGRLNSLQLIEGSFYSDDREYLKFIVAVSNLSNAIWSSRGEHDDNLGVVLAYHLVDDNGMVLLFDGPRSKISFVLAPGDTHYMAVNVPTFWKERGAAFVDIELLQEGVSWFGNPLRVPI